MQYDPLCRIDIYSHFFTVTRFNGRIAGIIYRFTLKYIRYKFVPSRGGAMKREADKVFGGINRNTTEFRFHIGQLGPLMKAFERDFIEPEFYEWFVHPLYTPDKVDIKSRESYTLKPDQLEAQRFILAPDNDGDLRTRFIAMPPGTGKTVVALVTTAHEECRTRTLITSLPKYLKKWPQDVLNITHCVEKDVVMVNGGDAVKAIVQQAKDGELKYPYVMISLTTLRNFYRDHYDDPVLTERVYGCKPQELCAILGIGQIIIDEAHEDLYGIFQIMIYNHVPKIIGLSGSLISKDPFVLNMQHLMFPTEIRFEEIKVEGFVKSYAISYNFQDFERANIRTTERGSNSYSHTAFEESIMKNPRLLENYLKLIASIVEMGYVQDYEEGDRFGVFAARKEMCDIIARYLAKRFPRFNVQRYIQGDPYENLIESDIRVTTVLSGGTAHDIPKLRGFLMTNNLDSVTGNVQAIGRLRHPDKAKVKDVKYYWIFCEQIAKHVAYHRSRMELLRDRVQFTKEFRSEILV